MSARLTTVLGLVCLTTAIVLMYLPFGFLYPGAATLSEVHYLGTAPKQHRAFLAPTELPANWFWAFLPGATFALAAACCMTRLARYAASDKPRQ